VSFSITDRTERRALEQWLAGSSVNPLFLKTASPWLSFPVSGEGMFLYIIMSYGLTHEPARCLFHPLLHFSCRAGDMFGRLFRIGLLAPLDTKKEYQRCVDHDYITVHYRFQRSHS